MEKHFSIRKLDGGFVVDYSSDNEDGVNTKIVRKLSEVVALVKAHLAEPATVTSGGVEIVNNA